MRPPPVYDQKDIDEANERLAAVDTRSIKKVAEAKFRKKKRAEVKMNQARKRASTIMDQDDVPDVSKAGTSTHNTFTPYLSALTRIFHRSTPVKTRN